MRNIVSAGHVLVFDGLLAFERRTGTVRADQQCPESSVQPGEPEADEALVSEPEKSESISFSELKADDSVSFTGQVVSSMKDGEDTICVQIQQDGRWVACYCQLQSEFIEKAAELETADIVSVKGLFSNMIDMKQENTAVLVYLYDCEISK